MLSPRIYSTLNSTLLGIFYSPADHHIIIVPRYRPTSQQSNLLALDVSNWLIHKYMFYLTVLTYIRLSSDFAWLRVWHDIISYREIVTTNEIQNKKPNERRKKNESMNTMNADACSLQFTTCFVLFHGVDMLFICHTKIKIECVAFEMKILIFPACL